MMRDAQPETTLEEITRLREELQVSRRALVALCVADDAHKAALKMMMASSLREAIEASENEDRMALRLKEAVTLCVELGRSLKDHV